MNISDGGRPEFNIVTCQMDDTDILARCLQGEVVIVRNLLNKIGWQQRFNSLVNRAVAQQVNESAAAEVARDGFELMHRSVETNRAQDIVKSLERKLARLSPSIHYSLLSSGILGNQPLWFLRRPIVRIHYPFDETWHYRKSLQKFKSTYGVGRMTPLRPHRDSWFSEPAECINIWISITPVGQGNSMCFFPDSYGLEMPFTPSQGIRRTQQVGKAVSIELSAGDALFMHAEHLHASELNSTDSTRLTLSLRVSTVSPKRTSKQPHRYARVSPAYPWTVLYLHAYWGYLTRKIESLRSKAFGARKPIQLVSDNSTADSCVDSIITGHTGKLAVSELEVNIPRLLSDKRCVVRLSDDSVLTFDRRCPHQGADLSFSNIAGQKLRCPWHNLEFDLRSGKSPCQSLRDLNVRQCETVGDNIELSTLETGG